jgi:hypothetical protein
MLKHVPRYLSALVIVTLVAALTVVGHASGQAGNSVPPARVGVAASPCRDKGPIAASALRVPVGSCDLAGRTVTYESARVVVPAPGQRACGRSTVKSTRYTVCAIDDGPVYAVTGMVSLPAACLQTGPIRASLLRTPVRNSHCELRTGVRRSEALIGPVRNSQCDLEGRLVRFDGIGAHVPATGSTTCVAADGTTGSESLCVTRDATAVFAVASSS